MLEKNEERDEGILVTQNFPMQHQWFLWPPFCTGLDKLINYLLAVTCSFDRCVRQVPLHGGKMSVHDPYTLVSSRSCN